MFAGGALQCNRSVRRHRAHVNLSSRSRDLASGPGEDPMSIRSCAVHRTLLSKFKLYYYAYGLLVAVLTVGLSAQVSPAASDLPSNQQVIAFLTQSIEWYRHRAIETTDRDQPSRSLRSWKTIGRLLRRLSNCRLILPELMRRLRQPPRQATRKGALRPRAAPRRSWRSSFSWKTTPNWRPGKQASKSRKSRKSF